MSKQITKTDKYLYRGVTKNYYVKNQGKLKPKLIKNPFEHTFLLDGTFTLDGSVIAGPCERNAVLAHQFNQRGFPTSGISTTPLIERAKYYATNGGKAKAGFIYKIQRTLLDKYGIKEYIVKEWIESPHVPEDEEVILVAENFNTLSERIVAEIIEV